MSDLSSVSDRDILAEVVKRGLAPKTEINASNLSVDEVIATFNNRYDFWSLGAVRYLEEDHAKGAYQLTLMNSGDKFKCQGLANMLADKAKNELIKNTNLPPQGNRGNFGNVIVT